MSNIIADAGYCCRYRGLLLMLQIQRIIADAWGLLLMLGIIIDVGGYCSHRGLLLMSTDAGDYCWCRGLLLLSRIIVDVEDYCCYRGLLMLGVIADIECYCCHRGLLLMSGLLLTLEVVDIGSQRWRGRLLLMSITADAGDTGSYCGHWRLLQISGIIADAEDCCWCWGLLQISGVIADTGSCCRYRALSLTLRIVVDTGDYCCHQGLLQMSNIIADAGCYCRYRGLLLILEGCCWCWGLLLIFGVIAAEEDCFLPHTDKIIDQEDAENYASEYLNAINLSSLPPHLLKLKVGAAFAISAHRQDCAMEHAFVLYGSVKESLNAKSLPVNMQETWFSYPSSSTADLPFDFQRTQFPLRLAFAITINKAQGQTLKHIGLCLTEPVFTHG